MPKTLKNNLTPQAVDDLLVVEEIFRKTDFGDTGITSFDLIKNDRGGNAKSFLGLGELGAESLEIDGVGEIAYNFEADSFTFKPADGFDGGTVEFEYAIQMGNGVVSSATASFEATVQNKEEILIDFNGLAPFRTQPKVENGHQGFNWDNIYVMDHDTYNGSGYQGLTAPGEDDAAFNGFGGDAGVSHAEGKDFDFLAGSFTNAWADMQDLIITAFDDGEQVGQATLSLQRKDVLNVNFLEKTSEGFGEAAFTGTFESIDSLEFSSSQSQFVMDDLLLAVEI